MEIAKTILEQLGGRMFVVMTGAKNITAIEDGIKFKIGRNHRSINLVTVHLNLSDTYVVKFCRIRKHEVKIVSEFDGVYCDMLQDIFTKETGMHTHF